MLASESERIRLELRGHSLRSLYFFAKVILGYKDLTPQLHLQVCRFMQTSSRQKLVELPRGHLKSTICTISYPLWRVCKDPNIRIFVTSATSTNASKFLREIMSHVEQNHLFRWLFPELIPDVNKVKWTETAMEVNRERHFPEATIEAMGAGAAAVSRHYNLKIFDDLVNEDHILEHEQMAKLVDWYKRSISLGVDPQVDEDVVIGNRWAFDDVISFVKDKQPYFVTYSRAAIEDGVPIWPERFSQDALDKILELQGAKIFSCQYMNSPVHEDARSFDPSWFRRFTDLPTKPMRFFTAVDPAIAVKHGDFSGIVTIGMASDRELYVVDARRGRFGVDELIDNIFDIQRTWNSQVGLETVMFQKALMWPLREAMRRHDRTFRVIELRPSSKITKEARISALHEYFANGSLWLRQGLDDLERELKEFPAGSHDDLADALAYAVQMAKPADETTKQVNDNPFSVDAIIRELEGRGSNAIPVFHFHKPYDRYSNLSRYNQ